MNKELNFYLRNSHPYDSLNLQTIKLASFLRAKGFQLSLTYLQSLTLLNKIMFFCFSNRSIIAVYGSFDFWLLLICRSKRLSIVYHNITPSKYFVYSSPLVALRSVLGLLQLKLFCKKMRIYAVSEFNYRELINLGFKNVVIAPCIAERMDTLAQDYKSICKFVNPTVIFTGRIVENKNYLQLLEQMVYLSSQLPNKLDLIIIGGVGKKRRYYREFIKAINKSSECEKINIEWISSHISDDDLRCLLAKSWLYVSMSLHEGFGLPVCESILVGTPSVYLECGGTESVLSKTGMVSMHEKEIYWKHVKKYLVDSNARALLLEKQTEILSKYSLTNLENVLLNAYK